MKRILLFALAICATSAFAVGIGNDNPPGGNAAQAQSQGQAQGQAQLQGQAQGQAQFTNVDVSNRISNDVRNNAAAFAGGGDAKSSSYSSGGSAKSSSGGNTLSNGGNTLTVNAAPIPTQTTTRIEQSDYTVKNVPSVFSGNVYPTAPCMGSSTVGGAGVGFGFSVGTSWKDDECGIRETARSFQGMGMKEDALAVLCSSSYAAIAPACKAMAPAPAQQPAQ